jgi:hypothetical protein
MTKISISTPSSTGLTTTKVRRQPKLTKVVVNRTAAKTAITEDDTEMKYQQKRPRICRIHVSQPAIRENLKQIRLGTGCGHEPVITVKRGKENVYGHEVRICDKDGNVVCTIMQPKDRKLGCGARVWVETHAYVEVDRESDDTGTLTTELGR